MRLSPRRRRSRGRAAPCHASPAVPPVPHAPAAEPGRAHHRSPQRSSGFDACGPRGSCSCSRPPRPLRQQHGTGRGDFYGGGRPWTMATGPPGSFGSVWGGFGGVSLLGRRGMVPCGLRSRPSRNGRGTGLFPHREAARPVSSSRASIPGYTTS